MHKKEEISYKEDKESMKITIGILLKKNIHTTGKYACAKLIGKKVVFFRWKSNDKEGFIQF